MFAYSANNNQTRFLIFKFDYSTVNFLVQVIRKTNTWQHWREISSDNRLSCVNEKAQDNIIVPESYPEFHVTKFSFVC